MRDMREALLKDTKNLLASYGVVSDSLYSAFIRVLDKYEVIERATEVSIVDTTSTQYIKMYLGSILTEGKSKRTVKVYSTILKCFMQDLPVPIAEASVFDIRLWLAKQQQSVSLRTCETYRSYLSAFYQWMLREGFIEKNPMSTIKPIQYVEAIKLPFSDVDIDLLRSACNSLRVRAELELMLSCGARVSEVCGLDIADVNFISKEVLIREGKGGKQRTVYINDVSLMHLKQYLATRQDTLPCLFITRRGTRITKATIEKDLKELSKRSGVINVHPHRCRRTFASTLARKGMSVGAIQKLMGHSNVDTTMCYITLSNQHIRNEYDRFN